MKKPELTVNECMEIFKKHDKYLYDYYKENMFGFGIHSRFYARSLKEKYED